MSTDTRLVEPARHCVQPPLLLEDPYAESVLAAPYPFQQKLREAAPVAFLPQYNVYAAGRYDVVREILQRPDAFISGGGVGLPDIRKTSDYRQPSKLNEVDPPEHGPVRSVVSRAFSPRMLRDMRDMMEAEAAKIADSIVEQATFDGVTDVAETFIFTVFPRVMGVPIPRENALAIAELRFNQSGPRNKLWERAVKQAEPYVEWYRSSSQRENILPEGMAADIFKAEDEGALESGVAANIVSTLVGGGTDTTIATIGFALHYLATNPDQFALAKADPACFRTIFDEAIRLDPASQIVYRTVRPEGAEIAGLALEGDRKLGMFLGAANRDPDRWDDPDRFDLRRKVTGQQLGLGHGIHVCVGQMLARMETQAILGALLDRATSIEPAGEPQLRLMNQVRALRNLPLRIKAA